MEHTLSQLKGFLVNWQPHSEGYRVSHNCLLLTGPVSSGKTTLLKRLWDDEDIKKRFHPVSVPVIDTMDFLKKRLRMKDVFAHLTTPILVFDPLDTYMLSEKGLLTSMFKELKSFEGKKVKPICLFVGSPLIDKKMGELKKSLQHVFHIADKARTAEVAVPESEMGDGRDKVFYNSHDVFRNPTMEAFDQFFSTDPWLTPLSVLDEVTSSLKKDRVAYIDLLSSLIHWGKIMNIQDDEEDFMQHYRVQISNSYLALAVSGVIQDRPALCSALNEKQSDHFKAQFTKLLTLHSVRKRTWNEKQTSGLPWICDERRRLGSKFSAASVNLIYG